MIKEKKFKSKAQTTLEYTLIFACLVAACVAMQGFLQRSVQGGLRMASDQIGKQYSPELTDSTISVKFDSHTAIKSKIIQAFHPETYVILEDEFGHPIYAMESETVDPGNTANRGHVNDKTRKLITEKLGDFKSELF